MQKLVHTIGPPGPLGPTTWSRKGKKMEIVLEKVIFNLSGHLNVAQKLFKSRLTFTRCICTREVRVSSHTAGKHYLSPHQSGLVNC